MERAFGPLLRPAHRLLRRITKGRHCVSRLLRITLLVPGVVDKPQAIEARSRALHHHGHQLICGTNSWQALQDLLCASICNSREEPQRLFPDVRGRACKSMTTLLR